MPSVFFKNYLKELNDIFSKVNPEEFDGVVKELTGAYESQSQIFMCGNAGSA